MSFPKRKFFFFPYKRKSFHRLFRRWHEILEWYENENKTDLPYWYQERTNIGHLALASYQLNGQPLQEFSVIKGIGSKRSSGRADLYLYVPSSRYNLGQSINYIIEAKQDWCSPTLESVRKAIKRSINSVMKDTRRLKDKEWKSIRKMGLVFLLPYKKMGTKRITDMQIRELNKQLREFTDDIKRVSDEHKADFVAIHYSDLKKSCSFKFTKRYLWCPGIVAIGKFL